MKLATVSEIRRELKTLPPEKLVDMCLQLARFKKDNKELLHYILYESQDEVAFVNVVREEMEEDFELLNNSSLYLAKKTVRKVLRKLNKYIRYSGKPTTAIELNIHFLTILNRSGLQLTRSKVMVNIYSRRLQLIRKAMDKLHPDLQFDYASDVKKLERPIE